MANQHPKYHLRGAPTFECVKKHTIHSAICDFAEEYPEHYREIFLPMDSRKKKWYRSPIVTKFKCINKNTIEKLYRYLKDKTTFECSIDGAHLSIVHEDSKIIIMYSSGRGFFFVDECDREVPSIEQQEMGTVLALRYLIEFDEYIDKEALSKWVGINLTDEWYNSNIWHAESIQNHFDFTRSYSVQLDSCPDSFGSKVYNHLRSLGFLEARDNWNPADIWVIKDEIYHLEAISKLDSVEKVNDYIKRCLRHSLIVPLSLKQVFEYQDVRIVDASKEARFSLEFDSMEYNLANTYWVMCSKGYPDKFTIYARAKAKAISKASDIRIYFEGKKAGSNEFLGAIPAKMIKSLYDNPDDVGDITVNDLKKMIDKVKEFNYTRFVNEDLIHTFDELKLKYTYAMVRYLWIIFSQGNEFLTELGYAGHKMTKYACVHAKVGG